ncbi:uncharacterized protein [Clytia hemisphaerica]|uniref:SCP domain-containing protein n=1 Tax=Clytia hemisphaerica TaxID=252671 RepID=A0A7M5X674_9CNID
MMNNLVCISSLCLLLLLLPITAANEDCQDASPLCKHIASNCDVHVMLAVACQKTCGECSVDGNTNNHLANLNGAVRIVTSTRTVQNGGLTKRQEMKQRQQMQRKARAEKRRLQRIMKRKLRMERRKEQQRRRAEKKRNQMKNKNKQKPKPKTETPPIEPPVKPTPVKPTPKPSSGTGPRDSLLSECFEKHNVYRSRHRMTDPLSWDNALQRSAQLYAEELARTKNFKHSSDLADKGENLYYGYSSGRVTKEGRCTRALDLWYDEIKDYNFSTGTGTPGKMIGHFTQMVWKDSKRIGIGMAISRDQTHIYVVAHYAPKGNYIGQFTQQVQRLK